MEDTRNRRPLVSPVESHAVVFGGTCKGGRQVKLVSIELGKLRVLTLSENRDCEKQANQIFST